MYRIYLVLLRFLHLIKSICLSKDFSKCGRNVLFGRVGLIYKPEFISIGNNTKFGDYIYLTAWDRILNHKPNLIIGDNCNFGAMNHITCANRIRIGNNLLTGKWVTISDNNHGSTDISDLLKKPLDREIVSKGEIIIGNNVWIGDKATILANVCIGDGVVIAANSVVTTDIPSYSVVVGNPGRIISNIQ
ncbi:MAG: acyltransferase [Bacteroidales bacterium]|nr:acyltransferase [Bacteroidales bacterium]